VACMRLKPRRDDSNRFDISITMFNKESDARLTIVIAIIVFALALRAIGVKW